MRNAGRRKNDDDAEAKQRKLHQAASECFGIFSGCDTRRSEKVRQAVRQSLRRQHIANAVIGKQRQN